MHHAVDCLVELSCGTAAGTYQSQLVAEKCFHYHQLTWMRSDQANSYERSNISPAAAADQTANKRSRHARQRPGQSIIPRSSREIYEAKHWTPENEVERLINYQVSIYKMM